MLGRIVLASVTMAMVTGAAGSALSQDIRRCDQLAAYYDRYGGRVSEGRTPTHRLERELGYQKCRRGDFADGIRLLEEAIRKSGYNVPAG
jgi:hypothetical protein